MQNGLEGIIERISKNGCRFYIEDIGGNRRSSTWVVKKSTASDGSQSSVYVFVPSLGGKLKLSLHPGGNYQWGMKNTFYEKMKEEGRGTFDYIRWKRAVTPEQGGLCVANLHFPEKYLKGSFSEFSENRKPSRPVFSLPMPPIGHSTDIGIFYSRESAALMEARFIKRGITPMICFDIGGGESVHLVSAIRSFRLISSSRGVCTRIETNYTPESDSEYSAIVVGDASDENTPLSLVEVNGVTSINQ